MKRSRCELPSVYLSAGPATVRIVRRTMECTAEGFIEFQDFMVGVSFTPNKHRPSTYILRQQCAFFTNDKQDKYDFGQKQDNFKLQDASPKLLKDVVDYVHKHYGTDYELFQCNYYAHGGVGISPHKDDEPCLDHDKSILSFSFYPTLEDARPFSFYTLEDAKFADVVLGQGDLLIMSPMVQQVIKHGIEKERSSKYGPRINVTARCLSKIP
jgi:alkylated DNA repair dioxygenase AlkB